MAPSSTRYQLGLLLANLILSALVLNVAHAKSLRHYLQPYAIDRRQFLIEHNAVRAQFGEQPLTWNRTLAQYARRFAGQRIANCDMVHSGGPYGENIFWGGRYEDHSAAAAVQNWASETKLYNAQQNSCQENQECGHYTQIVWSTTSRLGCARVKCNSGGVFTICVYDPPGNFQGENPFTKQVTDLMSSITQQFGGLKFSVDKDSGTTKSSQMPFFTVNNKPRSSPPSPPNSPPEKDHPDNSSTMKKAPAAPAAPEAPEGPAAPEAPAAPAAPATPAGPAAPAALATRTQFKVPGTYP